jgi:hypothetical protein
LLIFNSFISKIVVDYAYLALTTPEIFDQQGFSGVTENEMESFSEEKIIARKVLHTNEKSILCVDFFN